MKVYAQNLWKILLNQDDAAGLSFAQTSPREFLRHHCPLYHGIPVLFPLTPPLSQRERGGVRGKVNIIEGFSQRLEYLSPRYTAPAV